MRLIFILLLIFIPFTECKNQDNKVLKGIPSPINQVLTEDSLPLLDTVITLAPFYKSPFQINNLRSAQAKKSLYRYFRKKSICPRFELKKPDTLKEQLCVEFDTVYKVESPVFSGGILSYWLGPPDLNGRCYEPQKAIIRKTKNGYQITDEGFLPPSFFIDSIVENKLYGYISNCGGKVTRPFKVTLR